MDISEIYRKKDKDEESSDNNDMTELVKASFAKMPQDATIMEALYILQQDCGRFLKTPKTFSQENQTAGDLIIPFYFKEEYQSVMKKYTDVWKEEEVDVMEKGGEMIDSVLSGKLTDATNKAKDFYKSKLSQKMIHNEEYGGKESILLYRNMTMRDIYMPFYLAFIANDRQENYIFESINPEILPNGSFSDYEKQFVTPFGYRNNSTIHAVQSFPYDVDVVKKKWKNIVFVDTQNSTSSVLIFLRWFYAYFSTVFLGNSHGMMVYLPNLLPAFLAKSQLYNVGEAKEEGEVFDSLYDTHNSNIFICKTSDSRNEALREMGKNVASFILSNNRYVLKLDGDIFRRPNEIIKFTELTGPNAILSKTNSMIRTGVNLYGDPYTFLYVTNISHVFSEDGYYNYVEGCKFCENTKYIIPGFDA